MTFEFAGTDALASPTEHLLPSLTALPPAAADTADCLVFRNYTVFPRAREVLRDGRRLQVGSRAFDLLVTLLAARGEVVSKSQIMKKVWPFLFVDETNLRFQIAGLRNMLGADADVIRTIPGRGYIMVVDAPADALRLGSADQNPARASARRSNGGRNNGASSPGAHHSPTEGEALPLIALVDNDPRSRESLSSFFARYELLVRAFASAEEVLQPDLLANLACIVTEAWLPGRSGIELQQEIAALGFDIPIIFVSAHADAHTIVAAIKGGAANFLPKPVQHGELLAAVQDALGDIEGALARRP